MYTLRVIDSDGIETNRLIELSYSVILKEQSQEHYSRAIEVVFGPNYKDNKEVCETVYGFVTSGDKYYPLYVHQSAYIMSDNGKTFDNLTHK